MNTRNLKKPVTEYAFLIEPPEFLADRTNSIEIKSDKLSQKFIKPEVMDRVAIFNYMIGNYDWSVPRLQNLVVLSQPDSEQPELGLVVPYDFDYSGIINSQYAIPPENAPIKSVRERLYLGICRSEDVFRNNLREFNNNKENFYKVINEFSYLSQRSKKEMTAYLDSFFRDFNNRGPIVYKLLGECLNF